MTKLTPEYYLRKIAKSKTPQEFFTANQHYYSYLLGLYNYAAQTTIQTVKNVIG